MRINTLFITAAVASGLTVHAQAGDVATVEQALAAMHQPYLGQAESSAVPSQGVASSAAVSLLETIDGWRDPAYRAAVVTTSSHHSVVEQSAASTIQDALVRMFNPTVGGGALGR